VILHALDARHAWLPANVALAVHGYLSEGAAIMDRDFGGGFPTLRLRDVPDDPATFATLHALGFVWRRLTHDEDPDAYEYVYPRTALVARHDRKCACDDCTDVCCCGDYRSDHTLYSEHGFVSARYYVPG
jgi:hypothetical protein